MEGSTNAEKLNTVLASFVADASRTTDLVADQQKQIAIVNAHAVYIAALLRNMTMQEFANLQTGVTNLVDAVDISLHNSIQLESTIDTVSQKIDQHITQLEMSIQKTAEHHALLDESASKIKEITDAITQFSKIGWSLAGLVGQAIFIFIVIVLGLFMSKRLLGEKIACSFAAGVGMYSN